MKQDSSGFSIPLFSLTEDTKNELEKEIKLLKKKLEIKDKKFKEERKLRTSFQSLYIQTLGDTQKREDEYKRKVGELNHKMDVVLNLMEDYARLRDEYAYLVAAEKSTADKKISSDNFLKAIK